MTLTLYAHPFSSYCQKVLVALYETETPFRLHLLDWRDAATLAEFERRWPLKKMPILVDGDRTVAETSVIIEHLQAFHPGAVRLIPEVPEAALEVRFKDRFFDNYVHTPLQKIVFDKLRGEDVKRDPIGVADARMLLDTAYEWLDERMVGRMWAAGEAFTLADCSAAPALFYADWAHPIPERLATLRAYRARLNARPSFARAIEEAREWRAFFPLGAPDRD